MDRGQSFTRPGQPREDVALVIRKADHLDLLRRCSPYLSHLSCRADVFDLDGVGDLVADLEIGDLVFQVPDQGPHAVAGQIAVFLVFRQRQVAEVEASLLAVVQGVHEPGPGEAVIVPCPELEREGFVHGRLDVGAGQHDGHFRFLVRFHVDAMDRILVDEPRVFSPPAETVDGRLFDDASHNDFRPLFFQHGLHGGLDPEENLGVRQFRVARDAPFQLRAFRHLDVPRLHVVGGDARIGRGRHAHAGAQDRGGRHDRDGMGVGLRIAQLHVVVERGGQRVEGVGERVGAGTFKREALPVEPAILHVEDPGRRDHAGSLSREGKRHALLHEPVPGDGHQDRARGVGDVPPGQAAGEHRHVTRPGRGHDQENQERPESRREGRQHAAKGYDPAEFHGTRGLDRDVADHVLEFVGSVRVVGSRAGQFHVRAQETEQLRGLPLDMGGGHRAVEPPEPTRPSADEHEPQDGEPDGQRGHAAAKRKQECTVQGKGGQEQADAPRGQQENPACMRPPPVQTPHLPQLALDGAVCVGCSHPLIWTLDVGCSTLDVRPVSHS